MFDKVGKMSGFFSNDIGIDLGTANTLVFVRGKGIVLAEPSVVAVDSTTNEVFAVGHKAKAMLGKTPRKIHAVRPMKDGVIADFEIAEGMIKALLNESHLRAVLFRPKILIAVPSELPAWKSALLKILPCVPELKKYFDRRTDGGSDWRRSSCS